MCGLDPLSSESDGDAADFLDRPTDQRRRGYALGFSVVRRLVFFGGGGLGRWRIGAIIAKERITRQTWRCHPCQDLLSFWSSPNSFFAVSKLSSIAHRWPSTATSVSMAVPAGHQVVKKARSSSAMGRRISSPRFHKPSFTLLNCSASRSANSR